MSNNQITREELEEKIRQLEAENKRLKTLSEPKNQENTVQVPEQFKAIFDVAQETVKDYFKNLNLNPSKGTIEINDQRYILVRASALSNEFFENIKQMYSEKTPVESFNIAKNFLFDIGHLIGMEDAKRFHQKMKLEDPISKLSAGPVHFAYSGWAFVDILPESNPSADENYFMKYHHPYSFEADSWIKAGKKSTEPVCIMNSAYSSGWCSESFGIPLTAVEISCKAKGDEHCTFIMAQPHKINSFLDREIAEKNIKQKPEPPFFFERKNIEEKLQKNEQMLSTAQRIAKIGSWEFNLQTQELYWSQELYNIFEIDPNSKHNLLESYYSRFEEEDLKALNLCIENCINHGGEYQLEHKIMLPKKRTKSIHCLGIPLLDKNNKVVKIFGIAQDITESKKQQEKLVLNLREKEILLKEVHHRVKNNLQIISSLLNLQSSFITDKHTQLLYEESQNRIKSIAAIHELLYQSSNISKINFQDYLNKLVIDLISSYYGKNKFIDFNIDAKQEFNLDTSIPLGLMINEIVSNALKHGISNKKGDQIYIEITSKKYPEFTLKIGDNGKGMDEAHLFENSDTLGMMLIHELAAQLDGTLTLDKSRKGTNFILEFKES